MGKVVGRNKNMNPRIVVAAGGRGVVTAVQYVSVFLGILYVMSYDKLLVADYLPCNAPYTKTRSRRSICSLRIVGRFFEYRSTMHLFVLFIEVVSFLPGTVHYYLLIP